MVRILPFRNTPAANSSAANNLLAFGLCALLLILTAATAPAQPSQPQPSPAKQAPTKPSTAAAPPATSSPVNPASPKPAPSPAKHNEGLPANQSPSVEESEPAGAEAAGDIEDEAPDPPAPPARGNALARQNASVQRQIGRTRQQGGFFVSSWFSDAPSGGQFSAGDSAPAADAEDCDPIDATVAEAYIRESARREGISSDLVREVVRKESGFNPCVVSPKGAIGMMQLMPDTAASLGVDDPFNPRQNIDGGVRMLKRLLDKYKGRPDLALAAYNAGEGAVDANQSVPNYEETQEYVSTIMKRVFEEPAKPARGLGKAPPAIPPIEPVKAPSK